MPNTHPATVAASMAMLDHMLDGRLIFGISPGGLLSDAELFGNLDADRNAMFLELINQVLEIWAGEAALQSQGQILEPLDGEYPDRRCRPGLPGAAGATAASADRRDRRCAVFKRRHGGGRARLGSDLGKLPAAGMGEEPLAEIRRRAASRRPGRGPRKPARGARASLSPTTIRPRKPTPPTRRTLRYYYRLAVHQLKRTAGSDGSRPSRSA